MEPNATGESTPTETRGTRHSPTEVRPRLTDTRSMRQDDAEYHGRVARWIRAYGRRAGQIDAGAVRKFAEGLRAEIDKAERAAIHDLRDQGFSWAEIGRDYGMTRQSAWERWGKDDR